jgi:hypothetical protein
MAAGVGKTFVTALGEGLSHMGTAAKSVGKGVGGSNQAAPLHAHNAASAVDAGVDDLHIAATIGKEQLTVIGEAAAARAHEAVGVVAPVVSEARMRFAAAISALRS